MNLITNPKRKKQIEEFIDHDHRVMDEYYNLTERNIGERKMEQEMRRLIEVDPEFYDPYQIILDLLIAKGKEKEAESLLAEVYESAVKRIADDKGRWPKRMEWGFLENRHLMRLIERHAYFRWGKGDTDEAIDIFRRLLHCNPGDNQGARNAILAIRLGLGPDEWQIPFEIKERGCMPGLDAGKLNDWFEENAKRFPEEFDWLLKEWEKTG